ncbi:unnamed protein product [Strongylus vulgaris]|uniref:Nose resistant-to-fluoxetine protein N-terminal domain-containing protein n=1 Tax=Strongylus vulgaris TaxID=40348 RepID=A0A3P7ISL0_STRVU|nr:unnamed protein product [Strongylus vulgaris]
MDLTIVNSGSYRECIEVVAPYQVQYCYVNTAITMDLEGAPKGMGIGPKFAVCMPESCTKKDIVNFLNNANIKALVPVEFTGTDCVPTRNTYSVSFWIFMCFMAFFISWAIIATVVDYVWQKYYKDKEQNKGDYIWITVRALLTYSIYSNGSIIMNVSPPKKGTLESLACIRFISMSWVTAGHVVMNEVSTDSFAPVLRMWDPLLSNTITNGFFSVDTFFLLSGLLVSYIFFKSKPSAKFVKNPMVWIMFYVHRWLR